MVKKEIVISNSEQETFFLGKAFAKSIQLGDNIGFYGDLGAGKTIFIKGICKHFEVDDEVTSPTFNFLNIYEGRNIIDKLDIYHIDLYRIKNRAEAFDIGFFEWLNLTNAIKLIEWADRIENLDSINFEIKIKYDLTEENKREIEIIRKD
jgi:tRNA threonylcarbamoyladenosine biosynthesis protein TsaE